MGRTLKLRKKIADSERVNNAVAALCAWYIRFVYRTSRWKRVGFEPLNELVATGEPVIAVLWHQRLMMTPYFFPLHLGPACTITSSARAGSMVGRIQERFGFQTIAMSSHKRHVSLSREVLRRMGQGVTIGIAADGPRGPARISSQVPLVWARTSRKRVFLITYSAKKGSEAGTWDKMLLLAPWNNGVFMCREWTQEVSRKTSPEMLETLRADLQSQLNDLTAECDRFVGRQPYLPAEQDPVVEAATAASAG